MLKQCAFVVIVLLLSITSPSVAGLREEVVTEVTRSTQLTDSGCAILGRFSPDGSMVAYVEVPKHFTPEGTHYFRARVHVWDGTADRLLAELPSADPQEQPFSPDYYLYNSGVRWFPSGNYLWMRPRLIRFADGAVTKAGREGDWFVLNDLWTLTKADEIALKHIVQGNPPPGADSDTGNSWLQRDDLPAVVPLESENWSYGRFRQCPTDPTRALYIGFDKHFEGCACTRGAQRTYLGGASLRTSALKRLTRGEGHRIAPLYATWSPDGRWIAYYRQGLTRGENPPDWRHLHVVRPDDASVDWWVTGDCPSAPYYWLSPTQILAPIGFTRRLNEPLPKVQLAVVSVPHGPSTCLTEGPYRHSVCDIDGSRLLVCERDLSGQYSQGNLYIIEAL